jgi:predicted XRE-type DNA-binding protein
MQARRNTSSHRHAGELAPDRYALDQQQVKAALGQQVAEAIRLYGLAQLSAAETLGIDQPKVSRLVRGQLDEFSTARLLRFLALLGSDVEIVVRAPITSQRRQIGRLRVVDNGQGK